ncbi:hypothetical protein [Psychrobacillus psychrotolerans]|uniref:hypothetical protein n=1 Tax=Psychrobacillus psychrotolerans TaxID=126156 RepID=UPI0033148AA6
MKKLLYILTLVLFLTACGSNEESEPVVEDTPVDEPKVEVPETEEKETVDLSWEEQIKQIAENEDVAADKFHAIELYMMDYEASVEEVDQFKSDIISEYKAGTYLNDITNHEFMLSNIFKSYIVEQNSDGAVKDFAFDYLQNMKYTYRGVDAVDSDAVKANEAQLNENLAEIE